MELDLVMWSKHGSSMAVLKQINKVVPAKLVKNKTVIIDDYDDLSSDAKHRFVENGWSIALNKGTGIVGAANTALSYVSSDYFASFEDDLLLSDNWWHVVSKMIENKDVAVASGMRFADKPAGVRKLQQYVAKKYRGEANLASWLRSRDMSAFALGKTLDNTLYKTKIIKGLGGFPKLRVNAGVETTLAYKIDQAGYKWIVDHNAQSVHLRKGLRQELNHQYFYGTQLYEIWRKIGTETNKPPPVTKLGVIRRFCISPFTGLFIAIQTKEPTILYIHPLIRFYYMKGLLRTSKIEY